MQRNAYLTFGLNIKTRKIISCSRYPQAVGVDLAAYLSTYLTAEALNDPEFKADYAELEEFICQGSEHRAMSVESATGGKSYRFMAYPDPTDPFTVYCALFISFDRDKSDPYIYDYLTGVYGCPYTVERIEKRMAEAAVGTLLVVDIDNFRKVNDAFSRAAGDECLRKFSRELREICEDDLIGRYGGDEFIIWVEGSNEEILAEKIKRILSVRYVATESGSTKEITVTCSVGAATFPLDAKNFARLFYKADKALGKAKNLAKNSAGFAGRNLFIHYGKPISNKSNEKGRKNERLFRAELRAVKTRCTLMCVAFAVLCAVIAVLFIVHYNKISTSREESIITIIVMLCAMWALILACSIIFAGLEIKNRRLRFIDPVTGGINHERFVIDAGKLVKSGRYAVVTVNIIHFKYVNEQLGHEMANGMLFKIHRELEGFIRRDELIVREYADRFTLLLRADKQLHERVDALYTLLTEAQYAGRRLTVKYTVGVYILPDGSKGAEVDLSVGFDRALFALLQTDEIENPIVCFNDHMLSKEIESVELEQRSEQALREGQFVVFYQLKRDIINDRWCGSEALVRWNDPITGMISPGRFVPIFERNGFIVELDKYVFREVCRDLRSDIDSGKRVLPVSVNLSRKHFVSDSFLDEYEEIMNKYKVPRHYIEFELTESIVMENEALLKKFIARVHAMGCTCSIDDFGSGYSSLNMLKEFNFDVVKFDRGFFYGDNGFDSDSQTIVFSLINLSHELGMKVVSEGIEQEDQKNFLLKHKCDMVQGFLYSKPVPHSQYVKNLEDAGVPAPAVKDEE